MEGFSGNGWSLIYLNSLLLIEFMADNDIYKYSALFPVPVRQKELIILCL